MKTNLQDLFIDVVHAEAEATHAHQQLAAACQRAQDATAAALRRTLAHARRWDINSRQWACQAIDLWVSSNIEFSEPSLAFAITLRPPDDEPFLFIRLTACIRVTELPNTRPLPTDLDLPATMPMNQPTRIYPHFRAQSWKTYPEVTLR